MGRSEIEGRCDRHPTHKHSNGVCPYCLSDRLTKFSRSSSSSTNSTFSSTASSTAYYSSYDSEVFSLDSSPPHVESRAKSILKLFKSGRMEVLRKSKSVGFYEGGKRMKEEEKKMKGKKGRLLTKLMMGGGGRRKQREANFFHSKTTKEKSSYKWIFFS